MAENARLGGEADQGRGYGVNGRVLWEIYDSESFSVGVTWEHLTQAERDHWERAACGIRDWFDDDGYFKPWQE